MLGRTATAALAATLLDRPELADPAHCAPLRPLVEVEIGDEDGARLRFSSDLTLPWPTTVCRCGAGA